MFIVSYYGGFSKLVIMGISYWFFVFFFVLEDIKNIGKFFYFLFILLELKSN